jgi:hypothetical protein
VRPAPPNIALQPTKRADRHTLVGFQLARFAAERGR